MRLVTATMLVIAQAGLNAVPAHALSPTPFHLVRVAAEDHGLAYGQVATGHIFHSANSGALPDVVACGQDASQMPTKGHVWTFQNTGTGGFYQTPVEVAVAADGTPEGFFTCADAVGDLNGDGWDDVVVAGAGNAPGVSETVVYLNKGLGDGTFQPGIVVDNAGHDSGGVVIGDFNGDGRPDIAASGYLNGNTQGEIYTYLNNGPDSAGKYSFTKMAVETGPGGLFEGGLALGDVKGSGKAQLVAGGTTGDVHAGEVRLYPAGGAAGFTKPLVSVANPGAGLVDGDLTLISNWKGDGTTAVAAIGADLSQTNQLRAWYPDGSGGFGLVMIDPLAPMAGSVSAAQISSASRRDLFANGFYDVSLNQQSGVVYAYGNNGDGTFGAHTVIADLGAGLGNGRGRTANLNGAGDGFACEGEKNTGTGDLNPQIYAWEPGPLPINQPPVALDGSAKTNINTAVTITMTGKDDGLPDPPAALTFRLKAGPSHGTLSNLNGNTGAVLYTPATGYTGPDSFTFIVNDSQYDSTNAGTITIHVGGGGQAPVAVNDAAGDSKNTTIKIYPLANDSDPDGGQIALNHYSSPAHGSLIVNPDGSFFYTPAKDYVGADEFTYTVIDSDDGLVSNTATVTINITTAWTAVNDKVSVFPTMGQIINVKKNDISDGNAADIHIVTPPAHGTATVKNGLVYYSPTIQSGQDSFTYNLVEASGATSNTATVSINVGYFNPIAVDDTESAVENNPVTFDAKVNDINPYDPDYFPMAISDYTQPQHGMVVLNGNGTFTYTPTDLFTGTDTFTYRLTNGLSYSNWATVTVGVQDGSEPIAVDDTESTAPGASVSFDVRTNDNAKGKAIVVQTFTMPQHGGLKFDTGIQMFTYTPNPGFTGTDTFTYRDVNTDNPALLSNHATVTITVADSSGGGPMAVDDSATLAAGTSIDIAVLANDNPNGGPVPLSINDFGQPQNGIVKQNGDKLTYTPNRGFTGFDSFVYRCKNPNNQISNQATVHVSVTTDGNGGGCPSPLIDPSFLNPTAGSTVNYPPDTVPTDVCVPVPSGVTHVTLYIAPHDNHAAEIAVGTIDAAIPGKYSVTVAIPSQFIGQNLDYYGGSKLSTGNKEFGVIHLAPSGQGPVANPDHVITKKNRAVIINVTGNDTDSTGNLPLVIHDFSQPAHGTVLKVSGSTFRYTPATGFVGKDFFTYNVIDTAGLISNTTTVTILVENGAGILGGPGGGRMMHFGGGSAGGPMGLRSADAGSDGSVLYIPLIGDPEDTTFLPGARRELTATLRLSNGQTLNAMGTLSPDGTAALIVRGAAGTIDVTATLIPSADNSTIDVSPTPDAEETITLDGTAQAAVSLDFASGTDLSVPIVPVPPDSILFGDGGGAWARLSDGGAALAPADAGATLARSEVPPGLAPIAGEMFSVATSAPLSIRVQLSSLSLASVAARSVHAADAASNVTVGVLSGNKWVALPSQIVDGVLAATLPSGGTFGVFSTVAAADAGADAFAIHEAFAYPNPARPGQTPTIHVEAGSRDEVIVTVYDEAGHRVTRVNTSGSPALVNGAWADEIPLNASDFASGIYTAVVVAKKAGAANLVRHLRLAILK